MAVNHIMGPIDIAVSGMRAQNKSMSAIYSNVANARTTDVGNGRPYRRVEAIFKTDGDEELPGVSVDRIAQDMSVFRKEFDPGHPHADENGYVQMPNVNLPHEMINLTVATRAYQANTAILKRYQQVVESALELLR